MYRSKSFVLSSLVIASAALFACGGAEEDGTATPDARVDGILALTGDSAAGAQVYSGSCASCHGASGEGVSGYSPALTAEVPEESDEELVEIIVYGEGEMPAQSSLTDQEVANVLAYCRETFGAYEGGEEKELH